MIGIGDMAREQDVRFRVDGGSGIDDTNDARVEKGSRGWESSPRPLLVEESDSPDHHKGV